MTGKSMGMEPQDHNAVDDDEDDLEDKERRPSLVRNALAPNVIPSSVMFPVLPPVTPPPTARPGRRRPYYGTKSPIANTAILSNRDGLTISPNVDAISCLASNQDNSAASSVVSHDIPLHPNVNSSRNRSISVTPSTAASGAQTSNETQLKLPPMSSLMIRRLQRDSQQNDSHTNCKQSVFLTSPAAGTRTSCAQQNTHPTSLFPGTRTNCVQQSEIPVSSVLGTKTSLVPQSTILASPCSGATRTNSVPPQMDMRMVYDNMMLGYFMPPPAAPNFCGKSSAINTGQTSQQEQYVRQALLPSRTLDNTETGSSTITHTFPTMQMDQLPTAPNSNSKGSTPVSRQMTPSGLLPSFAPNPLTHLRHCQDAQTFCNRTNSTKSNLLMNSSADAESISMPRCTAMDITTSGCTSLEISSYPACQQQSDVINSLMSFSPNTNLFPNKNEFEDCEISSESVGSSTSLPSSVVNQGVSLQTEVQSPTLSDISSVFLTPQDTMMPGSMTPSQPSAPAESSTCIDPSGYTKGIMSQMCSSDSNSHLQMKADSAWGRYPVLPPVMNSITPISSSCVDGDPASYTGSHSSQAGVLQSPFSPYPLLSDISYMHSSIFAASPRLSGRSSYSGRGSRNKRALSNSPLSAEGIDLNSIIRMSPTSLAAYISGSRSSSSCVSPGSAGERTGCYGHLSARNSSSSPHSGSGSSGARMSIPYTPQMTASSLSLQRELSNNGNTKSDYQEMDSNILLLQAMQALEEGNGAIASDDRSIENKGIISNVAVVPGSEGNLQILPQNLAVYKAEPLIKDSGMPYTPTTLPPVHTYVSQQRPAQCLTQTLKVPPPGKPPPSYDQHMARKATLQKNNSSDSSQPSNYSSFESSEGDKLAVGSSSTDSEQTRLFMCRWLDCTSVFHDQDEFVTHIEKSHIDQKKGEDFVCFWKACPRRMHPFNARYKLLVHMRVHSGDKPNKCTYTGCKKAFSRLENLKIHMRSHTGERPYSCTHPGCTKTFSNSSDRAKHQRTHQDTRPYVCQVSGCGKRYTDPSSLRKHAKSNHADKKDQSRKKIRGGIEELDPNVVNECLLIKSIPPISHYDVSPPEPTDSGLGRSPRGSQPGSSSDHYPGLNFSSDTNSRSGTAQGSSCHTSPSSYHSSPPMQSEAAEREKLRPNNENRQMPLLPPVIQNPHSTGINMLHSPKPRPQSLATPSLSGDSNSSLSIFESSNGNICMETLTKGLAAPLMGNNNFPPAYYENFSPRNRNDFSNENEELLPDAIFEALSRFEGVS